MAAGRRSQAVTDRRLGILRLVDLSVSRCSHAVEGEIRALTGDLALPEARLMFVIFHFLQYVV